MFGIFSRKAVDAAAQQYADLQVARANATPKPEYTSTNDKPTTDPSSNTSLRRIHHQQQLRTPSPSIASGPGPHSPVASPDRGIMLPVLEPSPPPSTDPRALYDLLLTIPPKVLHDYVLAHTTSPLSESLSPLSLTVLTTFFSALTPPPLLHCARCHKGFFDVENTDRSCTVAHDDDSAEVEYVGLSKAGGHQTMWGCCGKTVEGDDGEVPDGWCYEGRHTTDTKRARFRADSTIHDDKLTSCDKLRCHAPPPPPPSSTGTKRKRSSSRKSISGSVHERERGASVAAVDVDESVSPKASGSGSGASKPVSRGQPLLGSDSDESSAEETDAEEEIWSKGKKVPASASVSVTLPVVKAKGRGKGKGKAKAVDDDGDVEMSAAESVSASKPKSQAQSKPKPNPKPRTVFAPLLTTSKPASKSASTPNVKAHPMPTPTPKKLQTKPLSRAASATPKSRGGSKKSLLAKRFEEVPDSEEEQEKAPRKKRRVA